MRVLRVVGVLLVAAVLGLAGSGLASAAPAVPAAVVPAAAVRALVPGTPCAVGVSACVDLSAPRAWLIRNGTVAYGPVPALGGRRSAPTTVGTFHVLWKDIDHRSHEFHNAPMPYSVFFTSGGIAFHQGSLRVPSSGCVHLSRAAARAFYASLHVGDLVQVVA